MRTRTLTATTLTAALAAVMLAGAGCTGPRERLLRPALDQFHTGTCYDAAPTVLAVGDLATRLRGAAAVSTVDQTALRTNQQALRRLRTSAELQRPVADLVTAIGFARLRLDSQTYDARLMDDVLRTEQRVVTRCVGG